MKIFTATLLALVSFGAFAQLTPKREALYQCMYQGSEATEIESVYVLSSRFGSNHFYELRVDAVVNGEEKITYKKVNLIEKYEGRVATYGTGNTRVRIDHVFPVEGKFKSFVRVPEYGMHSLEWLCKDISIK